MIMLTALAETDDVVTGLDLGASDYLTKPFAFAELLARIRARLRQPGQVNATSLEVGRINLDFRTREVHRNGRAVKLTAREFELLAYLMRHPDQVLSRAQILNAVWGYDYDPGTNVLDVYIGYLRGSCRGRRRRPHRDGALGRVPAGERRCVNGSRGGSGFGWCSRSRRSAWRRSRRASSPSTRRPAANLRSRIDRELNEQYAEFQRRVLSTGTSTIPPRCKRRPRASSPVSATTRRLASTLITPDGLPPVTNQRRIVDEELAESHAGEQRERRGRAPAGSSRPAMG